MKWVVCRACAGLLLYLVWAILREMETTMSAVTRKPKKYIVQAEDASGEWTSQYQTDSLYEAEEWIARRGCPTLYRIVKREDVDRAETQSPRRIKFREFL